MKFVGLHVFLSLFLGTQFLWGQKIITGRSIPTQFSMIEFASQPKKIDVSLNKEYKAKLQFSDLDSVLKSVPVRPNSVAVLIGVEQYDFIPHAPYAHRDAELMARFFKRLLGVERVIVHTNREVSGFFFENLFDADEGELARIVEAGKTDLYVYYSGHGIPSGQGEDLYLVPIDCKLQLIDKQGFSLNRLFEELDQLSTRSTTIFIDACFSGLGKFSQSNQPLNLMNTKGVRVRSLLYQPWLSNPKFHLLAASSFNQPALVLDEVQQGLFSYYLARGISGEADVNRDEHLSLGELYRYLSIHVKENSRKIYQEQSPVLFGNEKFLLY